MESLCITTRSSDDLTNRDLDPALRPILKAEWITVARQRQDIIDAARARLQWGDVSGATQILQAESRPRTDNSVIARLADTLVLAAEQLASGEVALAELTLRTELSSPLLSGGEFCA